MTGDVAGALTPEACERGYNNRAAVPNHAEYFARWPKDSALARSTLRSTLDVRFGKRPKETLDLFHGTGKRGLVVFIHGGYWRAFDKSDFSFVARPFVAEGLDVAVVNYDLCPVVDIGTIIDECRNALAWLVSHGGAYGVAVDRIIVTGDSAGGHLAAVLHATDWAARGVDTRAIRAGVSLSGVFDLAPLILTSLNADLRLDAQSAAGWSPVHMQPAIDAPFLIAVGADETSEFIRQSQLQWDAWPAVRPRGRTGPLLVEGCNHFSALDRFADPSHRLYREMVAFFG